MAEREAGGCGCCSAPALAPAVPVARGEGRSFRVSGLDCAEEVAILTRVLGPELGEGNLAFDVINGRMTVLPAADGVPDEVIVRLVRSTGMSAAPWDDAAAGADQARHFRLQRRFTALSGGLMAAGFLYHGVEQGLSGLPALFAGHGGAPVPFAEAVFFVLAALAGAWLVAPKAWSALRHRAPDMNLLMMVAVAGAIGLGEFFEAAAVAFFFALSLALESWSVGRARNAIAALLDLAPPMARRLRADGSEEEVPAASLAPGERFVLRGGDRIALDGVVVEGAGAVDQAPITGESMPVPKEPGDEVFAGTINGEGALVVEATRAAGDTMLARIIRMVGDAHARRAPVEQWVTRFARVYTPLVMAAAILIALLPPVILGGGFGYWFYNALVLLVIACPCALVISTPVSIVAALASAARHGVLIKGGAYIEAPARLDALALDKTGTLTMGEPEIARIHPLGQESEASLLAAAAALEARSSHPLARAVLARAKAAGIEPRAARGVRVLPGRGVEGVFDGRPLWLGSARLAGERGALDALDPGVLAGIEDGGGTVVVLGKGRTPLGAIELRDRIRPDARAIIARLRALGVGRIVMLTGDNERAAKAVARAVGIDEVRAGLLPEDKLAAIEELTAGHGVVAMVGDGINDAPAMARAHLAVAMGAMGSDAAIETADIALMTDDLSRLPWLVDHSRRTMRIIRQNIGFALATKALFAGLTALGMATMWGAILADVGVSLLVVANALRLLRAGDAPLAVEGTPAGRALAPGHQAS